MTTEKMLQDIQEKIWDKTLGFWCLIEVWWEHKDICTWKCWDTHIFWNNYRTIDKWWISEIIWHPISLSRVLSALGDEYPCSYQVDMWYIDILDEKLSKIPRKLLTEDWSDAMLSDQSPETIKAIREIVCK